MLVQQVLESIVAQRGAVDCREGGIGGLAMPLCQPGAKNSDRVFAKRRVAEFASFSLASDECHRGERNIFAAEPEKLRSSQPGLDGDEE
jgi:hypothetical protein